MFRLRKPIMSSSSYELCGTITPSIMLILIINMWGMSWWWINPFHSTNQTQKWEVINWWITTQLLKPNTTKYCTKVAHNLRVAFVHTMGEKRCWGRLCFFFGSCYKLFVACTPCVSKTSPWGWQSKAWRWNIKLLQEQRSSLPSSILVGNIAPRTGSYQHASEDNTGEQALVLGRDIPLLPNQWSNEGQQHELHGVREPARAGVYKNKRLELPKPHGCKRVIRGVRFHVDLLAAAAPNRSAKWWNKAYAIRSLAGSRNYEQMNRESWRSEAEQEELGAREGGSQPSRPRRRGRTAADRVLQGTGEHHGERRGSGVC